MIVDFWRQRYIGLLRQNFTTFLHIKLTVIARLTLVAPKWSPELAIETIYVLINTFILRTICKCLEDPGVDRRIILTRIFSKWDGEGTWTGLIWLRIGTGSGRL